MSFQQGLSRPQRSGAQPRRHRQQRRQLEHRRLQGLAGAVRGRLRQFHRRLESASDAGIGVTVGGGAGQVHAGQHHDDEQSARHRDQRRRASSASTPTASSPSRATASSTSTRTATSSMHRAPKLTGYAVNANGQDRAGEPRPAASVDVRLSRRSPTSTERAWCSTSIHARRRSPRPSTSTTRRPTTRPRR